MGRSNICALLMAIVLVFLNCQPVFANESVMINFSAFEFPVQLSSVLEPYEDFAKAQIMYGLIEKGIIDRIGMEDEAYIDFEQYGFSNEDGSEDRELLSKVYKLVIFNHPECFYVTGGYSRMTDKATGKKLLGFSPQYYEFAREPGAVDRFNSAVDALLQEVVGIEDPVEIMLTLYDDLSIFNSYNWEVATDRRDEAGDEAWTAYSALVSGDPVCKGYARAYRLLLLRVGIPCIMVYSSEMNHIWNMVKIGDDCYHVDVDSSNGPAPSFKGRSRHTCFLLSDQTIGQYGYHDWTAYGPQGWENAAPACDSKLFETGWAFNDQAGHSISNQAEYPFYRQEDGSYYYLRHTGRQSCTLYHGAISEPGEMIASFPLYIRVDEDGSWRSGSGVVWARGCLYYVDMDKVLNRYELDTGINQVIGGVPFEPMPSQDGYYSEDVDAIGLSLDQETEEIVAISRTRREVIASYSAF